MPKQTQQSSLLKKLGPKAIEAARKHKNDDYKVSSFADLPGGIKNGVAKLVDCRFIEIAEGKENAGKMMFYAAGVVVLPHEHDGVPIEGLRTQISEPLYDTPNRKVQTQEGHIVEVQQYLKGLGAEGDGLEVDSMEATAAALVQVGPYFRFSTWAPPKQVIDQDKDGKWYLFDEDQKTKARKRVAGKGPYKSEKDATTANPYAGNEPRTLHRWEGLVDYTPSNGEVTEAAVQDRSTPTQDESAADEASAPFDETTGDLDSLVETAAGDDEDASAARKTLTDMAVSAGYSEDEVNDASSWEEVKGMIEDPKTDEERNIEENKEDEEPAGAPSKGDTCSYTPLDKSGKPVKNPRTKKNVVVDCEIIAVNTAKETVDLKSLVDNKTVYKGVKWDAVSTE